MKAFFKKIKEFMTQHKVWTSVITGVLVLAILGAVFLPMLLPELSGKCKVSFVTNGGENCETIWVEKGQPISEDVLPLTTKEGYRFYGWFTDEALSLQYVDAPVNDNMTLYAGFSVNKGPTEVEYPEVYIGTVEPDLALAVVSSEKLTNENIGQYIKLTVQYGKHEDGTPITLKVAENGQGKYLITANYASPGSYAVSIVSGYVYIDENEEMTALGLSASSQKITFNTTGGNVEKLTYSNAFNEAAEGEILAFSETAVQVAAGSKLSINDVISLPGVNDFGFVKLEKEITESEAMDTGLLAADGASKFYSIVRAKVNEVYADMDVYKTEDVPADQYLTDEDQFASELAESLKNDSKIDAFTTLLLQSAAYTPEYQNLMGTSGITTLGASPSVMPLAGTSGTGGSSLGEIEFEVDVSREKDPEFARAIKGYDDKEFFKISLSIYRKSTVTRRVGADLNVNAKVMLDFYIYVGSEGMWVKNGGSHDFRGGVILGTHTRVGFEVSLSVEEEELDITESLRNKFKDLDEAESKQVMSLYEALVPSSDSQLVEIYRRQLFEAPVFNFYGFQLSVPVDLVISVDFRVALTAEYSAMRLEKVGVEGNTAKLTKAVIYREYTPTYTSYTVQVQGKIELRAGVEVGAELTFMDVEELGYIRLSAQAGVYVEVHGMGYATNVITNGRLGSCGGAYYIEAGFYIKIDFKAELFSLIGGQKTLWDYKFAVFTHGEKDLVYGFANTNTANEIVFSVDGVYLQDIPGMLDLYVYDITRERSDMRRVDGSYLIGDYLNASFDSTKFQYDSDTGKLSIRDIYKNSSNVSGTMVIRYEDSSLSFGACMYKTVKIRFVCERLADIDPEELSKTCTVTLKYNGYVCKTYEYPYGAVIPFKYTLRRTPGVERSSEQVQKSYDTDISIEVYNKFGIIAMEYESPGGYITEDIVIEDGVPTKYLSQNYTFNYMDSTGAWVSKTLNLRHCQVPDLSEFEEACPPGCELIGWSADINERTFACAGGWYPYPITAQYAYRDSVMISFEMDDDVKLLDGSGRELANRNVCMVYDESFTNYLDYSAKKEGYNFIGWKCKYSSVADARGQTYKAFTPYFPAEKISFFTMEPVFEQKPYAITFCDGEKETTEYYNAGDVIILQNMQYGEDYIVGWSSQADGAMHRVTYTVTGNDTLTCRYEKDVCFVIFDLNGGYFPDSPYYPTGAGSICETMYVVKGETLTDIEDPWHLTTDGINYVFSHWSAPIDQPITEDMTFTAVYKEDAEFYTVTYDFAGGKLPDGAELPEGAVLSEDGTRLTVSVKEGDYAPYVKDPVLVKDDGMDYTFTGWSPALEPVTADTTYTAVYNSAPNRFTIIFELNGGKLPAGAKLPTGAALSDDGQKITVTVKKGEGIPNIDNPILTKNDGKTYIFVEWSPAFEPVTADATYKAIYEEYVPVVGPGEDVDNPVDPDDVAGVHYKFKNGVLTIYGTGKIDNYTVDPEDRNVRPWDTHYDQIAKIVIEDGITYIGNHAFSYLPNLTSVEMADSVTSAGFCCFMDCPKLTNVKLSNGIRCNQSTYDQSDGNDFSSMFSGCTSLKSITLPSGFERVPTQMFHSCESLQTVNLPDSLKVIENGAFINCISLKSITLPDTLQTIEGYAFSGCTALESVIGGNNATVEEEAFSECPNLKN